MLENDHEKNGSILIDPDNNTDELFEIIRLFKLGELKYFPEKLTLTGDFNPPALSKNSNGVGSNKNYDFLKEEFLKENVVEFELDDVLFSDINFLGDYHKLKKVRILGNNLKDVFSLEHPRIESTLEELLVSPIDKGDMEIFSMNIKNLSRFQRLRKVELSACLLTELQYFKSINLQESITEISLYQICDDIEEIRLKYFRDYVKLESLKLENYEVNDFHELIGSSLEKTLTTLHIDERDYDGSGGRTLDLSALNDFERLESLSLKFADLKYFKGLKSLNLEKNIKYLDLSNSNFSAIQVLKNYQKLETLHLGHQQDIDYESLAELGYTFSIRDLLKYDFVKNKSLKEISLPSSHINWLEVGELYWKEGKPTGYINQEVIRELKRRKVEVKIEGGDFSYSSKIPSREDVLDTVLKKLTEDSQLAEHLYRVLDPLTLEFVENNGSNLVFNNQGRVSKKVSIIGSYLFKATSPENLSREYSIYSSSLGRFDDFRPELIIKDQIYNHELGLVVMQNLREKNIKSKFSETRKIRTKDNNDLDKKVMLSLESKYKRLVETDERIVDTKGKAPDSLKSFDLLGSYVLKEGAESIHDYIDHYMYVLGLFHTSKAENLDLLPPVHGLSDGRNYVDLTKEAMNPEYQYLMKSFGIKSSDVNLMIDEIQDQIRENAYCPILGDFKINNTVKGYVIDFDRVRLGNPLEDVAKFLEQTELGLTHEEKMYFVGRYVQHRRTHDELSDENVQHMFKFYEKQALYENLRVLSGKCLWGQNMQNPYYKNKVLATQDNVKRLIG